jgi:hypothetical protein
MVKACIEAEQLSRTFYALAAFVRASTRFLIALAWLLGLFG